MARKAKTAVSTAPTAMEPVVAAAGAGPAPETIMVRSHRIACDGVGGALGHPRVGLEIGAVGCVDCPYSDRRDIAPTAHGQEEDEKLAPGVYEGSGGH
jgi:uncharacterized Zn-finger protein